MEAVRCACGADNGLGGWCAEPVRGWCGVDAEAGRGGGGALCKWRRQRGGGFAVRSRCEAGAEAGRGRGLGLRRRSREHARESKGNCRQVMSDFFFLQLL